MDQRLLAAVCRIIVGRNGRRLPAYPDILAAYTQGLFADYFLYNPIVSKKTIYKYASGTNPYPHFLFRHYNGPDGYRRTLGDMMNIVDSCPSRTLLLQILDEVHALLIAFLPTEEAEYVSRNYVCHNATRGEIAKFLADVMHHAICRENITNRPTKSGELV